MTFAFEGARWRDVLDLIAESADLALHVGDLPRGTFTYSDSRAYTPSEAINRVNLFLLAEGFTLIRSDRLLSVIDLSDPRSGEQMNSLARMVTVQQLNQLDDQTLVKCFFALGEVAAEEAIEELEALQLLQPPSVFSRTKQLLIVDTVERLKSVQRILDSFEPQKLRNGTVVRSFALKHVDAEDFLLVARPHLGLATGEMIGIDVSISSDPEGRNIFVTGVEDKVKVIEGLLESIDKPESGSTDSKAELRMHPVENGNVELVYSVLQTLLAGQTSIRLSTDEAAGGIVALASPAVQKQIEETIRQLQASDAQFEVIPLKKVDPYFAIGLLQQMLDLPDPLDPESDRRDKEQKAFDLPRIDADASGMKLFVRAKPHELKQIREMVAQLEGSSVDGERAANSGIRIYPLTGPQAVQTLRVAAGFWGEPNPIFLHGLRTTTSKQVVEKIVSDDEKEPGVPSLPTDSEDPPRLLTPDADPTAPEVRCQQLKRGILMRCSDSDVLDRLEDLLNTIAGPKSSAMIAPTVFYLKYSKADAAVRMLADLLDGEGTLTDSQASSLVNRYLSSENYLLGSLVSSKDGMTMMSSGTATVVAEMRLNRVIVQGTADDVSRIERYLTIIDKESSLTKIQIYGSSRVIELQNVDATEVADVIREAYGDRVAKSSNPGVRRPDGKNPQPPQPPKPADDGKNRKTGDRGTETKPAQTTEPQMTLAVHEPSNSLVVTAPDGLFQEVEKLVQMIDARSKRNVLFLPMTDNATESILLRAFAEQEAGRSQVPRAGATGTYKERSKSDR